MHPDIQRLLEISIHAPTRGATAEGVRNTPYMGISIHAPTRGATCIIPSTISTEIFQSTLPQGERLLHHTQYDFHGDISIHAPTRGATNQILSSAALPKNFNPRSHKGSDHGGAGKVHKAAGISIHAPTRGATLLTRPERRGRTRFQSTLPQGERPWRSWNNANAHLFQSTLPQGERPQGMQSPGK